MFDLGATRDAQILAGGTDLPAQAALLEQAQKRLHSGVDPSRSESTHGTGYRIVGPCVRMLPPPEVAPSIHVKHPVVDVTVPCDHPA